MAIGVLRRQRASETVKQRRLLPQVLLAFAFGCAISLRGRWSDEVKDSLFASTAFTAAKAPAPSTLSAAAATGSADQASKRLLVLGGNGYVGREVCKLAVERGYKVSSLSRRGENPEPGNELLDQVRWIQGNAADEELLKGLVAEADAAVHAIGLLFDANSGLTNLNLIVSGSGSVPDDTSTYDMTTRKTAFNLINAIKSKWKMPFSSEPPMPLMFVSAAEAGWPDVALGPEVEQVAPNWLQEYLVAKRAVEGELMSSTDVLRPAIFRPSLIWSWTKFDVLPVIPVFNILSALGVPFVDKTVTVFTLSKAIMAGLEDSSISGVQRFEQMENLEQAI